MKIAGVGVAGDRGLVGTSDGDVALHAAADAILGAAALGDLGTHFPSSDPAWHGADSSVLLARVVEMAGEAGHAVSQIDITIIAETVRIGSHRQEMIDHVAKLLSIAPEQVSVKATTTDGMGYIGRDEGISATAVAVLD